MRLASVLLTFLFICSFTRLSAQLPKTPDGIKQPRILILLDGSSSMLSSWKENTPRFKAAATLVGKLMDSVYKVNKNVEFALRVYGHQYPAQENNCTDTRREVMFSKDNYTQMLLRMESIRPSGVSPMAYALKTAVQEDLVNEYQNAYGVILITDGGESCGGKVCEIAQDLLYRKIFFKSFLINLNGNVTDYNGYTCLGDNLIVSNQDDITRTVGRIMDTYTPFLKEPIKVDAVTQVQQASEKKPEPPADFSVVAIPRSLRPTTSSMQMMPVVITKNPQPMFHYNPVLRPLRIKPLPIKKFEHEPEPPTEMSALPSNQSNTPLNTTLPRPATATASNVKPATVQPIRKEPDPVVVQPKPVATQPVKDTAKTKVEIKPIAEVKTAGTKTVPVKKPDNKPKEVTYTISSEDAKETTVQIYFTDGHGKFYKTTPKLQLVNPKGEAVKSFYRTIDQGGNPDPLPVPAGTYSLVLPGSNKSYLKNVTIAPNKNNKLVAVVNAGSLSFFYVGAPDRPVEEFEALVNILFEPGPTVKQVCTARLEYAPGNYHVEVNTLPVSRYNVDIDFGNVSDLPVRQPGFVQFTNTSPIGRVRLFYQLGDRYVSFYNMELNGVRDAQKLRLQPGLYEVHYVKNANLPMAQETVTRFTVNSNAITEIELH